MVCMLLITVSLLTCIASASEMNSDAVIQSKIDQIDQLRQELDELKGSIQPEEESPYGKLEVHGFLSQGFLKSNGNNLIPRAKDGTFELNEIGVNFTTQLSPKLRLGMQLMSRDFGETDNNKVKLDWAVADYRWQDYMGFRAGRLKMPMGMYSETRDIDACRTSILLPINNIYHENWRELMGYINGVGAYGNINTDTLGTFSYNALYGYTTFDSTDGATSQVARSKTSLGTLDKIYSDYSIFTRVDWYVPFLDGLKLGASYGQFQYNHDYIQPDTGSTLPIARGKTTNGATYNWRFNDLRTKTVSAEYTYGDLVVFGEWMTTELTNELLSLDQRNWWAGASYRVNDWFQIGGYHSACYYISANRADPSKRTYDNALSLRFDVHPNWIVKAECHYVDGTKDMNALYNTSGYEDSKCIMWLLKTTFSF